ncbi:hypothetical protein SNEBB_001953 [Seison nebaliae]|nr:hypothetical protein SNEBB_001953 [Seison nebaliae]
MTQVKHYILQHTNVVGRTYGRNRLRKKRELGTAFDNMEVTPLITIQRTFSLPPRTKLSKFDLGHRLDDISADSRKLIEGQMRQSRKLEEVLFQQDTTATQKPAGINIEPKFEVNDT